MCINVFRLYSRKIYPIFIINILLPSNLFHLAYRSSSLDCGSSLYDHMSLLELSVNFFLLDPIGSFLIKLIPLFFQLIQPHHSQVPHHLCVLLLLKPCLQLYNSHTSKVEIWWVIGSHKLMDLIHGIEYIPKLIIKLFAGIKKLQD